MHQRLEYCGCIIFLLITLGNTNSLPLSQQISYVSFLNDNLFFLTQSKSYFGMISYQSQLYTMQQKVKEEETVIRFEPEDKYFVLGKQKDKALLFKLAQLNIEQINVQFRSEQHKIVDVLMKNGLIYVLTNKDLHIHSKAQSQLKQTGKQILTSCRKNEWFMKCFENNGKVIIVLRREQQLCIRVLRRGEKAKQKCLFNISSEVTHIDRVEDGILIQTKMSNYLIGENLQASSFQGLITQVGHNFITFSEDFRTFSLATKNFTAGLSAVGSTPQHQFLLKENDEKKIDLVYNDVLVKSLGNTRPKRAWIHQLESTLFLLVLQYRQNHLQFKQITLKEGTAAQQIQSQQQDGNVQL